MKYKVQVGYTEQDDPEWEDSEEVPGEFDSTEAADAAIDAFIDRAGEASFSYPREDFRIVEVVK